ncbi:MAG: AbrB/MazE/SpoVT family DNA-binding domain-containing protein [Defluviitaleaceae bacterium]|nr:AbrB/MazE/SpoVT family DNA-binding domain-containing protein [Defluviitaleaceae bacterium]
MSNTERTIDLLGRLNIPAALLQKQGWGTGDNVSLTIAGSTIVLEQCTNKDSTHSKDIRTIDALGRIVIPAPLRRTQNWATRDKISLSSQNNTITLQLSQRHAG